MKWRQQQPRSSPARTELKSRDVNIDRTFVQTDYVPVAVVTRAGVAESLHHGVAVAADASGDIIASWGNPDHITFPRSSLKLFQAVGLVETGAADAFALGSEHLAMACASHRGEPIHDAVVGRWLSRLAVSEHALVCGPDYPTHEPSAYAHIRAGRSKSRLWHNCSGKHCGFLTLARHLGAPQPGYDDPGHACQKYYIEVLSEFLGYPADDLSWGIDGCALPAPAMRMSDAALSLARYAACATPSPVRKAAIERLIAAMRAHPRLVSGTSTINEFIISATNGDVLVKTGAEGFIVAIAPARGLSLAVKVADGTSRARVAVLIEALRQLGLLTDSAAEQLTATTVPPVLSSLGKPVGDIQVCLGAPQR
jgi:L-asparaginase II